MALRTAVVLIIGCVVAATPWPGHARPRSPATTVKAAPPPKTIFVGPRGDPVRALPPGHDGRLVFAVESSARHTVPAAHLPILDRLGKEIARGGDVTLTGACNGHPERVRQAATCAGGETIGISAYRTPAAHRKAGAPHEGFSVIKLTSLPAVHRGQARANLIGRSIDEIAHSDAVICTYGRTGTLIEFGVAFEEKKPIGVLVGLGGISDELKGLVKTVAKAGKKSAAPIIFDSDPTRLVRRLRKATLEFKKLGIRGQLGDT
jgi:hypothetical protein